MTDPRDYKLDLSTGDSPVNGSSPATSPASPMSPTSPPAARPFVSVQFACCNVYLRIYRSTDGGSYQGRCPKCGVPVHFAVGPGGTDSRSFVVR